MAEDQNRYGNHFKETMEHIRKLPASERSAMYNRRVEASAVQKPEQTSSARRA